MAHPCLSASLSPSTLVAPSVSRHGSAKSSQPDARALGNQAFGNQKAFPRIAITRPAVPPQQALTTTSRINRNASLQPRRFGFPVEAAEVGADVDMRRLAGRMVDWPTTLRWVPAIECEPAHMRPLCRLGRPQCGTVDKRRGHNPIRPITIR